MYRPENPISMCKGGFLSKDGRCKSFDARADGYGRGEGAGIVVLKKLSTALRDENDIYAVIRGTGVNQDGRTNGITVPNPESQEHLVRRVCREAGVNPRHIRYFEAHGTGTAVGDPLEARALGAVVGRERDPGNPCIVGSVKANIGHLEAASGVAGIIKAALCLKNGQIPPVANLETPNPNIPFEELGLRLPRGLEPMPAGVGPALVGVNSFGYGGTNAHAILEEAPAVAAPPASSDDTDMGPWILPISARAPKALQALATAYRDLATEDSGVRLRDLCHSAGVRRGHHDLRCAVVAQSRAGLRERLTAVAEGAPAQGVARGDCAVKGQNPVFVFTGMGPQWWAMGRELYDTDPVFRRTAATVDDIFRQVAGWSILDEMLAEEAVSRMTETHITQPANFVVQAGLAAMWRARGIEPAAVVGHSVGEVTAAHVAGVLSLEDAVKVSFHRSRIQHKAAGLGTMLAVGLGVAEATALLVDHGDRVSVAAANSPSATTLAGDRDALEAIAAELERQGLFNRFLQVEIAYHSPYMDPLRPELLESLSELEPRAPELPLYSTVTGHQVAGVAYDAEYWCRNVREPVYFAKAIDGLMVDGHRLFLEVGPHPVLSTSIKECARAAGVDVLTVASLRRGEPERAQFLTALGELYAAGTSINWQRQSPAGGRFVKLPTYPWQRETYWHESMASLADRLGRSTHPLLGFRMDGPDDAWSQALNPNYLPYLPDHEVDGLVVLPGAAYVKLGFAVRHEAGCGTAGAIEELCFAKALVIGAREEPELRTVYHPGNREYGVYSRTGEGDPWLLHATGRLSLLPLGESPRLDLEAIRTRSVEHRDGALHHRSMEARGLRYGPWFQGVRELWLDADGREILARIERKEPIDESRPQEAIDPTLLDACFQTLLVMLDSSDRRIYVPVAIRRVALWERLGSRIWCHGRRTGGTDDTMVGDIRLCDEAGNVLAEVRGVCAQALNRPEDGVEANLDRWFYEYGWVRSGTESVEAGATPVGRWLLLLDRQGVGERVGRALYARDAEILSVRRGGGFAVLGDGTFRVSPGDRAEVVRLLRSVDPASLSGIVCFWGLDANEESDPVGIETVAGGLNLVQALAEVRSERPAPLFLITRGAQPVLPDETETALTQAPLVGLVRVAVNEYHEQPFRSVDLDPNDDTLSLLLRELGAVDGEEEIAYRDGERYVRRLNRKPGAELAAATLDRMLRVGAPKPTAGEVAVAVYGYSLGRSEAQRLGQSAGTPEAELFATGIVTATGPGVRSPSVDDPVLAIYRGEPAQSLILPASAVVSLAPMGEDALGTFAGQALPFVTSHYALRHLARVGTGERVLIHEADVPQGLAAVQVALALGTEVFATVRDPARERLVRQQGAIRVVDGQSPDFAERVLELTGGQGVNAAFGVFAGEYAGKVGEALAPLGRMISVVDEGDDGGPLNLSGLANRSIFRICPKALRAERPDLFADLVREVQVLLEERAYAPIALPVFDPGVPEEPAGIPDAVPAGGRVAISVDERLKAHAVVGRKAASKLPFCPDGTYLVTGGFGGFGMEMARWMAKQGVRHLVLVGAARSSQRRAKDLVAQLQRAGVTVFVAAADISQEAEVVALLIQVAACMPPLRGVFHAAAVLDDSPLNFSDPARFAAVMRPKALGAWYLHRHTRDLSLDLFVMFSSISALIGNPAQGSYVAANVVLDALAHMRRAQGLPAVSINWGALSEVGMVAQDSEVEEYFKRVGIGFFNPVQALEVLGKILEWNPVQVGAAVIDCPLWGQFNPAWAASPRYRHLIADAIRQTAGAATNAFCAALFGLPPEEHPEYVTTALVELISEIMRIPVDKIDRRQSLVNLGVDSLMAMELQTAIARKTGAKLSTLELMKGNAIEQLAAQVLACVEKAGQDAAGTPAPSPDGLDRPIDAADSTPMADDATILARLDDLSEEELDAMLATLMKI
jgi:acyl transferase domain-containing protein/acyl carrier protein